MIPKKPPTDKYLLALLSLSLYHSPLLVSFAYRRFKLVLSLKKFFLEVGGHFFDESLTDIKTEN